MTTHRCTAILLLLACVAAPLSAQAPEDPLSAIRARTELGEEDLTAIRAFVTQRVGDTVGDDTVLARQATQALRAAFAGSDAFKQAYAAACINVIGSAYKKAKLMPATRLLTVVHAFDVLAAQPVFTAALQDERVGVRAAGAVGLRGLRPKVARSDPQAYADVLKALKDAGKKEKSRDTLRSIYAALDYASIPQPPDLAPDAAALLELLEERAKLHVAEQDVPALGADDVGLAASRRLVPALAADQRQRLMIVAATMVKRAIEEYTSPKYKLYEVQDKSLDQPAITRRDAVERIVLVGEELLVALLRPSQQPAVMDNMRKLNTTGMKLEWQKWVALLQTTVNQDFTLVEVPEPASTEPANEGEPGGG